MSSSTTVVQPESPEAAIAAFGSGEGVTVLGGGTVLMPEINYGHQKVETALILAHAGLDYVRENGDGITVGAMTSLSEAVGLPDPMGSVAATIADLEIRRQATVGGNICAPAGIGDLQAALIACGAMVRSTGSGGERVEPIEDFLINRRDRLVLDISFSPPSAASVRFVQRPHTKAPGILTVCGARTSDVLRLAASGAGPVGMRLTSAEGGDAAEAISDAELQDTALASAAFRKRELVRLVGEVLDELGGS